MPSTHKITYSYAEMKEISNIAPHTRLRTQAAHETDTSYFLIGAGASFRSGAAIGHVDLFGTRHQSSLLNFIMFIVLSESTLRREQIYRE